MGFDDAHHFFPFFERAYPQIIHPPSENATGGVITCRKDYS